jgi:hypothetical protein
MAARMSRRERNNGIALAILAVLSVLAFQRITNWRGPGAPPPPVAPPPLERRFYVPEPPPLPRWEPDRDRRQEEATTGFADRLTFGEHRRGSHGTAWMADGSAPPG